jgi:ABC-type proline/glycine betaine transport system permease subunit
MLQASKVLLLMSLKVTQKSQKELFLNLINKDLLGDISLCIVIMVFVIGTLLGILKMNQSELLDQFEFPKPEEYWFVNTMPSIAMASICILIILRKKSLKNFLIQEMKERLSKYFNFDL